MEKIIFEDRRTAEQKARAEENGKKLVARARELCEIVPAICKKLPNEDIDVIVELMHISGRVIENLASRVVSPENLATAIPQLISAVDTARAKRRAFLRIARDADGKQAAKAEAFKLWQAWQAGRTLHKSGAAFARHVCATLTVIDSPITVERWARNWAAASQKNSSVRAECALSRLVASPANCRRTMHAQAF